MTGVGKTLDYKIEFWYHDGEVAARIANLLTDNLIGYSEYDYLGPQRIIHLENSVPR